MCYGTTHSGLKSFFSENISDMNSSALGFNEWTPEFGNLGYVKFRTECRRAQNKYIRTIDRIFVKSLSRPD